MTAADKVHALVEKYFKPLVNTDGCASAAQAPGGICGVLYEGAVYYHSYGYFDAQGVPPTKDTVFGLGSVTKTLTTSILGQQDPHLLTESVDVFLPLGYTLTQQERPATFAQLATFTAGIVPSIPANRESTTQAEFQSFINGIVPKNGVLPTANVYSDASIGFLAQILMGMEGYESFGQSETDAWWKKSLLEALGMRYTGAPATADAGHPLSNAYGLKDGKYCTIDYDGWVPWGAAGRAYSTCSDMMVFVQANAGISAINGMQIPAAILAGMRAAQEGWAPSESGNTNRRQAFAWILFNPDSPDRYVGKDGSVPGVSSFVTACSGRKAGVVMLTNRQGLAPEPAAVGLTEGLLAL